MTNLELENMLMELGFPVAYNYFDEGGEISAPFIVYRMIETNNFIADNVVWVQKTDWAIELYTEKKSFEQEKLLEELFNENEIPWDKYETYIPGERLFQVTYEITT